MFDPTKSHKLLTIADVAKHWKVSQERVRQLIAAGKVIPDYYTEEPRYYWILLPERNSHV